jgi:hypothetical protein
MVRRLTRVLVSDASFCDGMLGQIVDGLRWESAGWPPIPRLKPLIVAALVTFAVKGPRLWKRHVLWIKTNTSNHEIDSKQPS